MALPLKAAAITLVGTTAFVASPCILPKNQHSLNTRLRGHDHYNDNEPTMFLKFQRENKEVQETLRKLPNDEDYPPKTPPIFLTPENIRQFVERAIRDLALYFVEKQIDLVEADEKETRIMKVLAGELLKGKKPLVPMLREVSNAAENQETREAAVWLLQWVQKHGHSIYHILHILQ